MKNYVITTALPYANGNLHLGHFFEATVADIKARYFKLYNKSYVFVSGADSHGAATTLYCHKNNLNIEEHLNSQYEQHKTSYEYLKVEYTSFSRTNTHLHKNVVNWCIENLIAYEVTNNIKLFNIKEVESWFDPITEQFLPDRYVVGQCPHCKVENQYPEICEYCNKKIEPTEIILPVNNISKNSVILKKSNHLLLNTTGFFENLKNYEQLFDNSVKNKILDPSLLNYESIDISRDKPYYGIEVNKDLFPELTHQYYYVWFDAPIGYLTFSFEIWLKDRLATKELFNSFLQTVQLEHFIGKDIAYFHTFLWLNILQRIIYKDKNNLAPVAQINFHGWLTLNHEKLSKSKGHSFDLSQFSSTQIDALRLYFFSKYDATIHDTELVEKEIYEGYNQTIVQGLANFYARTIKIVNDHNLQNCIAWDKSHELLPEYENLLVKGRYKKLHEILRSKLSDLNSQFQEQALWKQNNREIILETSQRLLKDWYRIYQVYNLVCPEVANSLENIHSNKFFHLAERLQPFSLFDK